MGNMLNDALSKIMGPLVQLQKNLSGQDGERWLDELKKFLRKEPTWGARPPVDKGKREEKIAKILAIIALASMIGAFFHSYLAFLLIFFRVSA